MRGSNFAKTTPSTARSFFYSDKSEVGQPIRQWPRGRVLPNTKRSNSLCCETSGAWPKSEPEISSRANSVESSDVLSALGELTSTLNMVVKRLEKTEHRIQSMDEKIKSTSSASDSAGLKAVKKVPVIVQVS